MKRQFRTENKKNWKKINYESNISTFDSKNEDFYRIKKSEDFQEILKERIEKTFSSTKKVNTTIRRLVSQRSKTSYSQKNLFEKAKNEENKNSDFEEMLRRFENILNNENENLKNKITNHLKKTLKSNAATKRQIEHAKSIKKKYRITISIEQNVMTTTAWFICQQRTTSNDISESQKNKKSDQTISRKKSWLIDKEHINKMQSHNSTKKLS